MVHSLPLLLSSLLLAACSTVVTGGGSGDESSTGEPSSGSTSGDPGVGGTEPGEELHPAVALTRAQDDALWNDYWQTHDSSGGSSGSGGGNLDPNDLFLHLSDVGVSCGSPTVELPCGGHYELTLVLPPALQQVGVYDLEDPALVQYSVMSESGANNSPSPSDCPWGGGSPGSGSVEVVSIDAAQVHFRVTFTGGLWDTDPTGEYVASRCP